MGEASTVGREAFMGKKENMEAKRYLLAFPVGLADLARSVSSFLCLLAA